MKTAELLSVTVNPFTITSGVCLELEEENGFILFALKHMLKQ